MIQGLLLLVPEVQNILGSLDSRSNEPPLMKTSAKWDDKGSWYDRVIGLK